jgi:hypothetical protein
MIDDEPLGPQLISHIYSSTTTDPAMLHVYDATLAWNSEAWRPSVDETDNYVSAGAL